MRLLIPAALAALVAGCAEMTGYYPEAQTVALEGREYFVTPRPQNGPGMYLAGPNDPSADEVLGGQGRALPARNVAAIEAVTGCKVLPATVRNQEVTTYAAVAC